MIYIFAIICTFIGLFNGCSGQFMPSSDYCYPGFTRHGSTCYRYINMETSWADAWTYCSTMGAHLVTIHTIDENYILTEIVKNYTQGQNDSMIERTWTAGTNLRGSLQWQNSRAPITYTSWASGEPYLASPDVVYCVMKFRNSWYADDCNHARRFICEAEIDGLVALPMDGQRSTSSNPNIPIG